VERKIVPALIFAPQPPAFHWLALVLVIAAANSSMTAANV
jgi:hypothetical protein